MRLAPAVLVTAAVAVVGLCPPAAAQVNVAGQVGDFYFAVGNYYRVPQREVIVIRERRMRDDEIPVVLFLAQHARVAPAAIIDIRRRGRSWMDIAFHYGLGPEIFYVPVAVMPGPPYGKAYGYYKKRPKHEWRNIRLADHDVVNFVNLRFLSDYYHAPPEDIIRYRGQRMTFVSIQSRYHGDRSRHGGGRYHGGRDRDDDDDRDRDRGHPGKGKGHGRGRGR